MCYFGVRCFSTLCSLAETLDGDVNVAMLVYQSGEAAIQLFSGDSPQARKILGAALPALATQGDYKVNTTFPALQQRSAQCSLVKASQHNTAVCSFSLTACCLNVKSHGLGRVMSVQCRVLPGLGGWSETKSLNSGMLYWTKCSVLPRSRDLAAYL